ncbi:TetR/AcrR family transcriptional regulator [Methylobacterium aquaticum]|uniref:TetR/AcrR family transcriptional regulator n=1 Tax=Methylobacterium aquaticum TaxID=270351 RepID=UPI003D1658C2
MKTSSAPKRGRTDAGPRQLDTRERLLDAAEKLFAERGFNGVSTREITFAAGANSAAMHYHFGSKEAVIREIFERRLGPINAERERLMDEGVAASDPPDIARILRAFIGPTLSIGNSVGERHFKILAARSSMDPNPEIRHTVFTFYDSVGSKFVDAIARACPHLGREELFWRLACVYGAMLYVRADNGRLQIIMGDDLSLGSADDALRFLIPVLAAGLALPPVGEAQPLQPDER